jgi:hypothetical protein
MFDAVDMVWSLPAVSGVGPGGGYEEGRGARRRPSCLDRGQPLARPWPSGCAAGAYHFTRARPRPVSPRSHLPSPNRHALTTRQVVNYHEATAYLAWRAAQDASPVAYRWARGGGACGGAARAVDPFARTLPRLPGATVAERTAGKLVRRVPPTKHAADSSSCLLPFHPTPLPA